MKRYIDVVIFKNLINLDRLFTYEVDYDIEIGDFVIVDFNNSLEIALVLKSYLSEEIEDTKEILAVVKEIKPLSSIYIDLGLWMKEFYILTYAKAFGPLCDFNKINNLRYEYIICENLDDSDRDLVKDANRGIPISNKDLSKLNILLDNSKIEKIVKYNIIQYDKINYFKFKDSFEDSKNKLRKNATKQYKLLEEIYNKLKDIFSSEEIKELTNYEKSVFDQLINKNLFLEVEQTEYNPINDNKINFTEEQELVYSNIISSSNNKFLIHGVTGSGKTEIYFKLIDETLKQGKTALFLVPEIGLTPQMEQRTRDRFGDLVSVIHSKVSKNKRIRDVNRINNGDSRIILGTRSSIFTEIPKLGLIIIDEEHDSSYKLDSHNKYDVREVARFLVEKIPESKLVLGSATPSIESYYKAQHKIYSLLELKNRPYGNLLPEIIIIDMRQELKAGNPTPFSLDLFASVKDSLNKTKQSLLFLNRRGFSTFVSCRDCGYTEKCEKCDISMVYHKKNNYLKCHYCGETKRNPRICPICGSKRIKYFGMGTEKLEELTKEYFKNISILRIDSDTTSRPSEYKDNVEKILNKEVAIIVGTQMISKGFDFPDIDSVGVIAADLSLNIPEYDSVEKTFQILMQVAGRAGRSKDRGKVIIQTYNPEHYVFNHITNHDYTGFYKEELQIRNIFSYPPFKRQYIITFLNRNISDGLKISSKMYKNLRVEIEKNNLIEEVGFVTQDDRFSISKINDRFHIKLYLNSNIKSEKYVKNCLYNVLIKNIYNLDLYNTHIDVITR